MKIKYFNYQADIHRILIKFLPLCHGVYAPCFNKGERRRQSTMYNKEELNWVFLCDRCNKVNEEHWEERWADYYRQY